MDSSTMKDCPSLKKVFVLKEIESVLRIRNAQECDIALLSKFGWDVITNEVSLWVHVMEANYLKQNNRLSYVHFFHVLEEYYEKCGAPL